MKRVTLLILILAVVAAAAPRISSVVLVHATTRADINRLMDLGYDVNTCRKPTSEGVEVYIEPERLPELEADGFTYEVLWADSRDEILPNVLYDGPLYDGTRDLDFDHYYTPAEANLALDYIHNLLPAVSKVYTIGTSVEGRPIKAIKITDNPGVEEVEPEVRLIGAHHGNEKISYMVLFYFLQRLANEYNEVPSNDFKRLVNNTELWVVPIMNPDGVHYDTRWNANNVDINRDYSYMWNGSGGSPSPFSQPETCAIRDLSIDNTFVVSHSHHAGALYINYIWNYVTMGPPDYVTPPNHDFIMELSYLYQEDSGYPIINGGDWYTTHGDCNDWSMGERGDLDDTIEISYSKTPNPSQIIYYSQLNDDAQLQTLLMPLDYGFQGVVTDADTDEPLDAEVYCNNSDIDWFAFTDPAKGDYYWPVMPGTYSITVSADGYYNKTINGIVVNAGTPTTVNVALNPTSNGNGVSLKGSFPFCLAQNAPNPTAGTTTFSFTLPEAGRTELSIYDLAGRRVGTVFNGEAEVGENRLEYSVSTLSPGIYLYRLTSTGETAVRKMVVTE